MYTVWAIGDTDIPTGTGAWCCCVFELAVPLFECLSLIVENSVPER